MSEVKQILERYEKAKGIRNESIDILEEIGRYVWPSSQDMTDTVNRPPGQVRTMEIFDSTARTAAHRMTAGFFSFIMPAGQNLTWFEYEAQSAEDRENDDIRKWLTTATSAVHSELLRSNFQREIFLMLRSMVVFGTGCISIEVDKKTKELLFRAYHLGDIFFEVNDKGEPDVVFRRIRYTTRQAVMKFKLKNVSDLIKKEYEAEEFNNKHEFVHAVFPRDDRDPDKIDAANMKFESVYIEVDQKKEVESGGFTRQVYLVGRLDRAPNEILGRGPAHDLLPEIRMINSMRATYIEGAESYHSPALLAEDDSIVGQPITGPRGMVYYRQGSPPPTPLNTGFDAAGLGSDIREQQIIIKNGYFNDLFDALENIKNVSSATEAEIRQMAKLVIVAPMTTGLQNELFEQIALQSLQLLAGIDGKKDAQNNRVIPEAPKDFEMDVVYQGRLSKAMSSLQSSSIEIWLSKWSAINELVPVLDNFDYDEGARTTMFNDGLPANVIRSVEDRDAIRQERKDLQQAADEAQIAETMSKAVKNVSGEVADTSLVNQL